MLEPSAPVWPDVSDDAMILLRPITAKIQAGLMALALLSALVYLALGTGPISLRFSMLGVSLLAAGVGAAAAAWVLGMNYVNPHCSDRRLQSMCMIFSVPAGLLAVGFLADTMVAPSRLHPQAFGFTALAVGSLAVWEKVRQGKRTERFQQPHTEAASSVASKNG